MPIKEPLFGLKRLLVESIRTADRKAGNNPRNTSMARHAWCGAIPNQPARHNSRNDGSSSPQSALRALAAAASDTTTTATASKAFKTPTASPAPTLFHKGSGVHARRQHGRYEQRYANRSEVPSTATKVSFWSVRASSAASVAVEPAPGRPAAIRAPRPQPHAQAPAPCIRTARYTPPPPHAHDV